MAFRRYTSIWVVLATLLMAMAFTVSAAQANLMDDVLKRGSIRVAVLHEGLGFGEFDENGELVGFDVDLAERLADKLGVRLDIVPVRTVDRIVVLLGGDVDLIVADLSRTSERARYIDFSVPYLITGASIVVQEHRNDIQGIEDLAGKRVGTVPGLYYDTWAREHQPEARYVDFISEHDRLPALLDGEIDAFIEDNTTASEYVRRYPDELKIVGSLLYRDYISIGLPRGEHDLRNWLNWFVFEMHENGEIAKLWEKHFPALELPEMVPNPYF